MLHTSLRLSFPPPLLFSPSYSSTELKEDALFVTTGEGNKEEGRVGGFVKAKNRALERGVMWYSWHPTAFVSSVYLSLSTRGGSNQPLPCPQNTHVHTAACSPPTSSTIQRHHQAPQSHGPFDGAGVFYKVLTSEACCQFCFKWMPQIERAHTHTDRILLPKN